MSNKNLVIWTQYRENYGAHTWDGEGDCPQHWKNKGGGTYVFENVTPKQEAKIAENGIPTLAKLINKGDEHSSNCIIEYLVVSSFGSMIAPWEYDYIHWLEYHQESELWFYTIRHDYNPNDPYRVVRTAKL